MRCARCRRAFASDGDSEPAGRAAAPQPQPQPLSVQPWAVDELLSAADEERLRGIGRQLRSARGLNAAPKPPSRAFRVDQPATPPPAAAGASAAPTSPRKASKTSQAVAWVVTLLGALVLGVGLAAMGWSLADQQPRLWNWGLAGTLGGQGLMIVGLVQLLANLWAAGRDASGRLIALHYEIRRLQRTADSLAGLRTATPSAFYADLSRGASPQVLMANLKGQVDAMDARLRAD